MNRRQFLKATGVAATTTPLAGCTNPDPALVATFYNVSETPEVLDIDIETPSSDLRVPQSKRVEPSTLTNYIALNFTRVKLPKSLEFTFQRAGQTVNQLERTYNESPEGNHYAVIGIEKDESVTADIIQGDLAEWFNKEHEIKFKSF